MATPWSIINKGLHRNEALIYYTGKTKSSP